MAGKKVPPLTKRIADILAELYTVQVATKTDSQKVHNPTVCALFPVAATLAVAHPEAGSSPNGT